MGAKLKKPFLFEFRGVLVPWELHLEAVSDHIALGTNTSHNQFKNKLN
jgi:hypothetical protein